MPETTPNLTGKPVSFQPNNPDACNKADFCRRISYRLQEKIIIIDGQTVEAGYACAYTGKWHLGTGGDRRGFTDFATRSGIHDVDGPEQNDMSRSELGGKLTGTDVDLSTYDARTQIGTALLPLAFHLSARDAA